MLPLSAVGCACVVVQMAAAAFVPNPNGAVTALALQNDGRLLVAGEFTVIDQQARGHIARLQPNGALDPTFDAGPIFGPDILQVAVQPDGQILVRSKAAVTRLNPDGSRGSVLTARLLDMAETTMMQLQPDGRILLSGTNSAEEYFSLHLRLNPDGSQQALFSHILGRAFAAAVRPDGAILYAGSDYAFLPNDSTWRRKGLARLQPTGAFDPSFDAGLNGAVDSLALQSDGRILVVGEFTRAGEQPRDHVARLDPDGFADPAFTPGAMIFPEGTRRSGLGPGGFFSKVVALPGGGVAMAGAFTSVAGKPRGGLARLTSSGALDETFEPALVGTVADMVVRPNGSLIVGGSFKFGTTPGVMNLAEIEPGGMPTLLTSPASRTVVAGSSTTLSVIASAADLRYQWRLNGTEVPGATSATYVIASVQAFHAGTYTVSASNDVGSVVSAGATVMVNRAAPSDAKLANISNRGFCAADDRVLVTGFTVTGTGARTVLIRAVGPTLATAFGLSGALADPQLAVHRSGPGGGDTLLFSNDDWGTNIDAGGIATVAAQVGAFALPRGTKDAALVVTLAPGGYTVVASGVGGATGIMLVEVYDVP